MRTYAPLTVSEQVDKMRAEIRLHGTSVVGCEEFTLLCSDVVSDNDKCKGIEQIAEWEGWVFENLPEGKMRFSSLRRN
jgi:hypothetical protein